MIAVGLFSGCGKSAREQAAEDAARKTAEAAATAAAEAQAKHDAEFAKYIPTETLKERNTLVTDPTLLGREHVAVYFTDDSHPEMTKIAADYLGPYFTAGTGLPVYFSTVPAPPSDALDSRVPGKPNGNALLQFVVRAKPLITYYTWEVKNNPMDPVVQELDVQLVRDNRVNVALDITRLPVMTRVFCPLQREYRIMGGRVGLERLNRELFGTALAGLADELRKDMPEFVLQPGPDGDTTRRLVNYYREAPHLPTPEEIKVALAKLAESDRQRGGDVAGARLRFICTYVVSRDLTAYAAVVSPYYRQWSDEDIVSNFITRPSFAKYLLLKQMLAEPKTPPLLGQLVSRPELWDDAGARSVLITHLRANYRKQPAFTLQVINQVPQKHLSALSFLRPINANSSDYMERDRYSAFANRGVKR